MREKLTRKSKPDFGCCLCDYCYYRFILTAAQFNACNEQLYNNHCGKCEGDSRYVNKEFIRAKNKRYIRKNGGCRSKQNLAWWHYNRLHPLPF